MKVKLTTGYACPEFAAAPGEIIDVDSATAKRLLESEQAEPVAEKRAGATEKRGGRVPATAEVR